MSAEDIRWMQRLNHFSKALSQLTKFIEKGTLNELEQQGLIKAFEYTFGLQARLARGRRNLDGHDQE